MKNTDSKRKWFATLCFCFLIVVLALAYLSPVSSPLSVSITHLGYTNGPMPAPYAMFAITNHSDSAITLDTMCMVKMSATRGALRNANAYDPYDLRITRLGPGEGFVQDVFIFPGTHGEWQFECYAAYSSIGLDLLRSLEKRVRKFFSYQRAPLTSKAWHTFETEWFPFPP